MPSPSHVLFFFVVNFRLLYHKHDVSKRTAKHTIEHCSRQHDNGFAKTPSSKTTSLRSQALQKAVCQALGLPQTSTYRRLLLLLEHEHAASLEVAAFLPVNHLLKAPAALASAA